MQINITLFYRSIPPLTPIFLLPIQISSVTIKGLQLRKPSMKKKREVHRTSSFGEVYLLRIFNLTFMPHSPWNACFFTNQNFVQYRLKTFSWEIHLWKKIKIGLAVLEKKICKGFSTRPLCPTPSKPHVCLPIKILFSID